MMPFTDSKSIKTLLDGFVGRRVAVLGDVMVDCWIEGVVQRISPEAPVPVVSMQRQTSMLGGAANVAKNAAALGATVDLYGVTGLDNWSNTYGELIADCHGIQDYGLSDPNRPTTVKTRLVGNHQQIARLDTESTQPLDNHLEDALARKFEQVCAKYDVVIISDYAKGVIGQELVQRVQTAAARNRTPVLVDPKTPDWQVYGTCDWITPNLQEFRDVVKRANLPQITLEDQARLLLQQHKFQNILVTQADQGMTLVNTAEDFHVCALPHEVADVSGAGDTVIAALALAVASGCLPREAVWLANTAAGITVTKSGTASVSREELLAQLTPGSLTLD